MLNFIHEQMALKQYLKSVSETSVHLTNIACYSLHLWLSANTARASLPGAEILNKT